MSSFNRVDVAGNIATGAGGSNGIITPPGFEAGTSNSTPDMADTLGGLYNMNKKSTATVGKKKKTGLVVKDGKIIKKRVKGFKPRQFKAPSSLKSNKKSKDSYEDAE